MAYQNSTKISFFWIVILLFVVTGTPAPAGTPPTDEAGDAPGFYYTIQKGDTLWSLSKKFYDSQWDWPGLWEMNKDLKNPHWIYPGKKIKVLLKSQAPEQIPQTREEPPEPQAPQVKVPDPITPTFVYPPMDRVGFIRETQAESLGKILREQEGHLMMTADDIVYIKPASPDALVPGQTYHIFGTEPVREKLGKETFRGVKHLIKAEVEILENKEDHSVGRIKASYRDVSAGDNIMEILPRPHELAIEKDPVPTDALLICSQDNTVMINDYRIAFINRGKKDHIRPGQIHSILKSQASRSFFDGKDTPSLPPLFAGRLIVLHTEENTATVMVISSTRDIHPGDLVN